MTFVYYKVYGIRDALLILMRIFLYIPPRKDQIVHLCVYK